MARTYHEKQVQGLIASIVAVAGLAWRGRAAVAALAALVLTLAQAVPLTAQSSDLGDEAEAGLALVNLDLLDRRDGYAIPADSRFLPGETIHVYFQIGGYQVGREFRISLSYETRALDPDGQSFFAAEGGKIDTELAPQDENWMPVVRYSPRIPDHAGGGTYSIQIIVRDELAQTSVTARLPIAVDGSRVQRADQLLVRNFGFSRAEGGDLLEDPVFDAGEEIWADFFITGYKTREDNTYQVESDAWVEDAEGEKLFDFKPAGEAGSPFYPRLWLPARLRLQLDESIPPGRYAVVLRLRDMVGGVDAIEHHDFRIR
ncbi:MAG: hypothetical protein OXN96_03760 [Bryobacterales bacterium]|nr:hypothetical protein [Bryobacterales bacterium]